MIFQSNKSFSDPFPWDLLSTSAKTDFFLSAPRYIQVGGYRLTSTYITMKSTNKIDNFDVLLNVFSFLILS